MTKTGQDGGMTGPLPTITPEAGEACTDGGYTLDGLECASGVPARTIRFYRQEGLLAPPRKVGRQAFYAADQLPRLRLIAALRKRGLGLEAVSKILADPAGEHRSLSNLLSIRDQLLQPWIDDDTAELSESDVMAIVGTDDADSLANLCLAGIIARSSGPAAYSVPSVATLELAGQLRTLGVDPHVAMASWAAMCSRIAELADNLVTIFAEHAGSGFDGPTTTEQVSEAFGQLRPIALRAVQVTFAHEIERALEVYVTKSQPDEA